MKFYAIAIISVFLCFKSSAQTISSSVVSASGGFYPSSAGSLSFTVSEMTMVQTFGTSSGILMQGFQQPTDFEVGINELLLNNEIKIYPVPAQNEINIGFKSDHDKKVLFRISDVPGKIVAGCNSDITSDKNIVTLNIANLQNGIYFITLYNPDGELFFTNKFQVLK
jgi:hypothetical protein